MPMSRREHYIICYEYREPLPIYLPDADSLEVIEFKSCLVVSRLFSGRASIDDGGTTVFFLHDHHTFCSCVVACCCNYSPWFTQRVTMKMSTTTSLCQIKYAVLLLSVALLGSIHAEEDYGVDVSFPIHHNKISDNFAWLPHNVDPSIPTPKQYEDKPVNPLPGRQEMYDEFLRTCEEAFGKKGLFQRRMLCTVCRIENGAIADAETFSGILDSFLGCLIRL